MPKYCGTRRGLSTLCSGFHRAERSFRLVQVLLDLLAQSNLDSMCLWRILWGVAFGMALTGGPCLAQESALGGQPARPVAFRKEVWSTDHGLPQNTIQALVQTADGALWIGTRGGLARFDGLEFKIFTTRTSPAIPSDAIFDLAEAEDGTLWIGTADGLVQWNGGVRRIFREADGLPISRVEMVRPLPNGSVWAHTGRGSAFLENGAFVPPPDALQAVGFTSNAGQVLFTRGQTFCFQTPAGVFELEQGSSSPRRLGDPAFISTGPVRAGDSVLFGSANAVLALRRDGWEGIATLPGGGRNPVVALATDGLTTLYASMGGGFLDVKPPANVSNRIHDPYWPRFGPSEVLRDREGSLWMGRTDEGLIQLRPQPVRTVDAVSLLASLDVWSITPRAQGGVWVGSSGGLFWVDDDLVARKVEGRFSSQVVRALLEDPDGGLWIGYGDERIDHWTPSVTTSWQVSGEVTALVRDRSGALWATTYSGVKRFLDGGWREVENDTGSPLTRPCGVFEDPAGTLWIGSDGQGLFQAKNGRITSRFSTTNGLPSNFCSVALRDEAGALWLFSTAGVIRHKNGVFSAVQKKDGLHDDTILSIIADGHGNFWMSTLRGIFSAAKRDLDAFLDGNLSRVADGMGSAEGNGDHLPNSCVTSDGRVWFSTMKGISVIDPVEAHRNRRPPMAVVSEVRANNTLLFSQDEPATASAWESGAVVRPGGGRILEFHYTANTFIAPEKTRFKYRLLGVEDRWTDAGARRVAYYPNLAPGKYQFQVVATNSRGDSSPATPPFVIALEPFFYETKGFYAACALAILLAGAGLQGYRLRVQRRILGLERERRLIQQRETFARDVHDDVAGDLTTINMLAEMARDLNGRHSPPQKELEEIGRLASEVIDKTKDIIWSTHPQSDTLSGLAARLRTLVDQALPESKYGRVVSFPEDLPEMPLAPGTRRNIYLAAKEALHNVAKHAACGNVEVRLELIGGQITIEIIDDGAGFDPANTGLGHGLKNMRDRLQGVGGSAQIISEPGKGTRVLLAAPIK